MSKWKHVYRRFCKLLCKHFFTFCWFVDIFLLYNSSFILSPFTISLPSFLETHCCRNRASSPRDRGVPEGGCPAGGHMGSLWKNNEYNAAKTGKSSIQMSVPKGYFIKRATVVRYCCVLSWFTPFHFTMDTNNIWNREKGLIKIFYFCLCVCHFFNKTLKHTVKENILYFITGCGKKLSCPVFKGKYIAQHHYNAH